MKSRRLNEATSRILDVFSKDPTIKKSIEEIKKKSDFVSGNEVTIIQDQNASHYANGIAKTWINPRDTYNNFQQKLTWQTRQLYRVVNSAVVSRDETLSPYIYDLKKFQLELEHTDELSVLLQDIDKGKRETTIFTSGHGTWYIEDGFCDSFSSRSKVTLYTPAGAYLYDSLAIKIENMQFDPYRVKIHDEFLNQTYICPSFPEVYDATNLDILGNFSFISTSEKHPARLIQTQTGIILKEVVNSHLLLDEILNTYPNQEIHWLGCTGVRSVQLPGEKFGPYAGYGWHFLETPENIEPAANTFQKYLDDVKRFSFFSNYPACKRKVEDEIARRDYMDYRN